VINRNNWKRTKEYLEYRLRVDQISTGSFQQEYTHLRYLLQWLQDVPFSDVKDKRPTLPEFLKNEALDGYQRLLSEPYLKKILATSRHFFFWLSEEVISYKNLNHSWRSTLQVKRMSHIPSVQEAVTLEDIQKMAVVPVSTLKDRRIQAAAVFLYLSGMRIGAFVSLPIMAVDLEKRMVKQHPNLGIRTKNGKHATTYLLDIPELLQVVQGWDSYVRSVLPAGGYWFAPFSPDTGKIDLNN
jgi:site-specific recombinase XerD